MDDATKGFDHDDQMARGAWYNRSFSSGGGGRVSYGESRRSGRRVHLARHGVHFAWLNTPKNNGGIEGVTYPILADSNRNLARILGILDSREI